MWCKEFLANIFLGETLKLVLLVYLFYLWKTKLNFSAHFDRRRPSAAGRRWATGSWSEWSQFPQNSGACATWIWNDGVWRTHFFSERCSSWRRVCRAWWGPPYLPLKNRSSCCNSDTASKDKSGSHLSGVLGGGFFENWEAKLGLTPAGDRNEQLCHNATWSFNEKKAKKSSENDCFKWFIGWALLCSYKLWLLQPQVLMLITDCVIQWWFDSIYFSR